MQFENLPLKSREFFFIAWEWLRIRTIMHNLGIPTSLLLDRPQTLENFMFLWNKPSNGQSNATLLLAHGSGLPMDSPFLESFSSLASESGLTVVRFEFPYMAERRQDGKKRPPPPAESMVENYLETFQSLRDQVAGPILIGGKSMGGRIAFMAAGRMESNAGINAVFCIGYPLHPINKPSQLRVTPLQNINLPCLIIQGERDPFGTRGELEQLNLPDSIQFQWSTDGDHDLVPPKKSPVSQIDNVNLAIQALVDFTLRTKRDS